VRWNELRVHKICHYHSMHFFFLFIGPEPTTWHANNCLQIMVCSCANRLIVFCWKYHILLMRNCNHALNLAIANRFPELSERFNIWKQTWWSNDKTIIELGCREISWFVSVSQFNYFPQPSTSANNWSARHWQITMFCSTSCPVIVNYLPVKKLEGALVLDSAVTLFTYFSKSLFNWNACAQ